MARVKSSAKMKFFMYLAIDVSESMGWEVENQPTPWESAQEGLQSIVESSLVRDAEIRQKCQLGIIAYNQSVQVKRRARDEARFTEPKLPKPIGQTDFKTLFERLDEIVEADMAYAFDQGWNAKIPAVYILTDGQPYLGETEQSPQQYLPAVQRFHGHNFKRRYSADGSRENYVRPIVVPFGFGQVPSPRARDAALCSFASPGMPAYVAEDSSATGGAVKGILDAIITSMVRSATSGAFMPETPAGARQLNCP